MVGLFKGELKLAILLHKPGLGMLLVRPQQDDELSLDTWVGVGELAHKGTAKGTHALKSDLEGKGWDLLKPGLEHTERVVLRLELPLVAVGEVVPAQVARPLQCMVVRLNCGEQGVDGQMWLGAWQLPETLDHGWVDKTDRASTAGEGHQGDKIMSILNCVAVRAVHGWAVPGQVPPMCPQVVLPYGQLAPTALGGNGTVTLVLICQADLG